MRSEQGGLPVPGQLQRGNHASREEWEASGAFAVELLQRTLGRADLADIELLDVGCGTKVVKTLLDNSLAIGHYAGVDVNPEVIDWLQAHVSDPRFEFHHLNAHNAMYNEDGESLASFDLLPVGPRRFDLISLFSVFTHLAPHDFASMLRLLRRHVKPGGKLLFSLFLDDPDHRSPYVRAVHEGWAKNDPEVRARVAAAIARRGLGGEPGDGADQQRGFVDEVPDRPLMVARYEKDFALGLIDGTGWEVVSLNPPERYIQHYLVCRQCRK